MKKSDEFNPLDIQGNEIKWIKCKFDSQGSCSININLEAKCYNNPSYLNNSRYWKSISSFTPPILFHKGDKKDGVNDRLVKDLEKDVKKLHTKCFNTLEGVKHKKQEFLDKLDTPLLTESELTIAIKSIDKQIEELELRIVDCQRLASMVEK